MKSWPPEKPILFMKTGVIYSAPEGFYQRLAEEYDALLIDPTEIKRELEADVSMPPHEVANIARAATAKQARVSLSAGRNVVYDGFLNHRAKRDEVRDTAIDEKEAFALVVCMHAPFALIKARVIERYERDQLSETPELPQPKDTMRVAQNMFRNIQWPDREEENALHLRGQESTEVSLDEIKAHLITALR